MALPEDTLGHIFMVFEFRGLVHGMSYRQCIGAEVVGGLVTLIVGCRPHLGLCDREDRT